MPPIMVSKSSKGSNKAPTKGDLEVVAGRVIRTDPRLKGKAGKATGVPKFLAQTLLKAIDKPRQFVFSGLIKPVFGEDVDSGYELADKLGLGTGLPGKIVGFGLDTALDPTTYLTAGAGGVARGAVKETAAKVLLEDVAKRGLISEGVLKTALGRVTETGGLAAAASESPIVRQIGEKVFGTEAAAAAGKRQTLSMANKAFSAEERAALKSAGVKTGGIRFMGQTVVPAATTAKVTAPIAEKLAPGFTKVVSRVSPKLVADAGVLGHTFVKGMREAEDGRHAADDVLRGLANETAKVVDRKNPEMVQAFFDKIWRPGQPELWAGKLGPKAEAAAEKWSASFATMLDEAQAAGVPIQKLQNWNGPRVLTPEAREALYGTEKLGGARVGATPGAAKHRTIADFDEAQELMADWLKLKPGQKFFSEDPFQALAQYGSVMNRTTHHSAAMKAFDEAGVRWGDLGKTGNNLRVQELKAAGFGKNGAKPIVEARRALWDAADDPRLAKLSSDTRKFLEADAELTQTKIVKKNLQQDIKLAAATAGKQRSERAGLKKLLTAEQAYASFQAKDSRHLELLAAKAAGLLSDAEVGTKATSEVARLSKRMESLGRLGAKASDAGGVRFDRVQKGLDEYYTLQKQIAGGEEGLAKIRAERAAVKAEREGLSQSRLDLQAAKKVGRVTPAEVATTQSGIDRKAAELAAKEENLAGRLSLHEDELQELRPQFDKLRTRLTTDLQRVKADSTKAKGYEKQAVSLQQQIDRVIKQFNTDELKSIEAEGRKVKSLLDDVYEAAKRVDKKEVRLVQLRQEKDNLLAGLEKSGKEFPGPKVSRGEVPEGFQVVSNTGLGEFDQKAWPAHVARELETNWKLGQPVFGQQWAGFTGLFKKWVTIPFPGFHVRNAIGGFFNNFIGGVKLSDYHLNELIQNLDTPAEQLIPSLGKTVGEVRQLMIENRIFSPIKGGGSQLADFAEGHVQGLTRGTPGWGIPGLQQASEAVESLGGGAIQEIEQRLRGAAFLRGLEDSGDAYAARMFTVQRHGDYEELTSFERNVLKQIIPFYKWMRMNTPLQLQTFIEAPGRVKMATGFFQNVVGDPNAQEQFTAQGGLIPPQVMAGGGAFTSPGGLLSKVLGGGSPTTISADLPFYGINNYFNAQGSVPFPSLTGFAADLHPILKTANELVFQKRFYGGGEVGDIKDYSPVGGVYHLVGKGLEKLPGGDVLAVRTESGEIRLNSKLLSLLNMFPTSRVASLTSQMEAFESGPMTGANLGRAGLSVLGGVRVSPLNEKSQSIEGYRRQNILDEAVTELYSRGLGEDYKATAPKKKGS